jgi:hypothetical protein
MCPTPWLWIPESVGNSERLDHFTTAGEFLPEVHDHLGLAPNQIALSGVGMEKGDAALQGVCYDWSTSIGATLIYGGFGDPGERVKIEGTCITLLANAVAKGLAELEALRKRLERCGP